MNVILITSFVALQFILYIEGKGEQTNIIVIDTITRTNNFVEKPFLILMEKSLTIEIKIDHCLYTNISSITLPPMSKELEQYRYSHQGEYNRRQRRNKSLPPDRLPPRRCGHKYSQTTCRALFENRTTFETCLVYSSCIRGQQVATLNIPADEVTGDISIPLLCNIDEELYEPGLKFDVKFTLKVKGGKRVRVEDNGQEQEFIETDILQETYDGYYRYQFVEGENVDLKCSNIYRTGHVKLKYYDNRDTLISTQEGSALEKPLIFRKFMGPTDHKSYVDCTYVQYFKEAKYSQEYTYRIKFNQDIFVLKVNSLTTAQMLRRREFGLDIYTYKYNHGENITFTCESKLGFKPEVKIFVNEKAAKSIVNDTSSKLRVSLNTENLEGGMIQCHAGSTMSGVIEFRAVSKYDHEESSPVLILACVTGVLVVVTVAALVYACWITKRNRREMVRKNRPKMPQPGSECLEYDYVYDHY